MTDQPQAHGGHPPAEKDQIHAWSIVRVGVGSLLIFALAGTAAVLYMQRARAELNPAYPVLAAEGGKHKVGLVEQQLFENANRAQARRAAQLRRLRAYGWVDRPAGQVHLPIDVAMDLSARGERP